ncbi:MAG: RNA-binding protein [Thermoproteota archaeon]|nr:MAG: RNA-binding protein [Candidatus Korarchaeota archaeon]
MVEKIICSSCGRDITYEREKTSFYCFNCGKARIYRCRLCRMFGRDYVCPNCGFEGP